LPLLLLLLLLLLGVLLLGVLLRRWPHALWPAARRPRPCRRDAHKRARLRQAWQLQEGVQRAPAAPP
jgi:hypothetical protein